MQPPYTDLSPPTDPTQPSHPSQPRRSHFHAAPTLAPPSRRDGLSLFVHWSHLTPTQPPALRPPISPSAHARGGYAMLYYCTPMVNLHVCYPLLGGWLVRTYAHLAGLPPRWFAYTGSPDAFHEPRGRSGESRAIAAQRSMPLAETCATRPWRASHPGTALRPSVSHREATPAGLVQGGRGRRWHSLRQRSGAPHAGRSSGGEFPHRASTTWPSPPPAIFPSRCPEVGSGRMALNTTLR